VRLSVPRLGGWHAWGTIRGEFERQLAEQESARGHLARGQRGPPGPRLRWRASSTPWADV